MGGGPSGDFRSRLGGWGERRTAQTPTAGRWSGTRDSGSIPSARAMVLDGCWWNPPSPVRSYGAAPYADGHAKRAGAFGVWVAGLRAGASAEPLGRWYGDAGGLRTPGRQGRFDRGRDGHAISSDRTPLPWHPSGIRSGHGSRPDLAAAHIGDGQALAQSRRPGAGGGALQLGRGPTLDQPALVGGYWGWAIC